MKTHISPAIIMRVREFGETDLLVTFFTPDQGRLKGVAKGARKSAKRFINCLDIFSLVNLEYELKRAGGLYFLHSGKLLNAFPGLRSDFAALSKASYMIELTEILFPWGMGDHKMFQLLRDAFDLMDKGEKPDLIPLLFEARAMALGGYGIYLERCCVCGRRYTGQGTAVFKREKGGIACLKCQKISAVSPRMGPNTAKMLKVIQSNPLATTKGLGFGDDIVRELKPVFRLHREYHLEKKLKTAKYVE